MKKIFMFFIIASTQLLAQSNQEMNFTPWSIGTRVGASLLPDFEKQVTNNYKLGWNGGISASYKLNKYLSLKTEFIFAQKGKSFQYQETQSLFSDFNQIIGMIIDTSIVDLAQGFINDAVTSNYYGYHKLGYLEFPLLAELKYYKFKLTAGPYMGLLVRSYTKESLDQSIPLLDLLDPAIDSLGFASFIVNGLIESSFPGYKATYTSESTSNSKFTQINYGFLIQLSYELYTNTFLEARYTRALNSYLVDSKSNIQLSTITFSLSYSFGIKRLKPKLN